MSDPTDYLASHGYWPWEAPNNTTKPRLTGVESGFRCVVPGPSQAFVPEPGTDLWFEWDSSRSPVGGPVRSPGSSPGGSQ